MGTEEEVENDFCGKNSAHTHTKYIQANQGAKVMHHDLPNW